jgi:hypothetical protein
MQIRYNFKHDSYLLNNDLLPNRFSQKREAGWGLSIIEFIKKIIIRLTQRVPNKIYEPFAD